MLRNDRDTSWDDVFVLQLLRLAGILVCVVLVIILAVVFALIPEKRTEISGPENYGNYTGTNNDAKVNDYINSFFPEKMEPYFSDVTFTYRSTDFGSYACEAYLEFTIEDPDQFDAYVASIADEAEWRVFSYDSSFLEYRIEDRLYLVVTNEESGEDKTRTSVVITDAEIGKVLYSSETQTIIYMAMLICSDSTVETDYFNAFFSRFAIDPTEYTDDVSYLE